MRSIITLGLAALVCSSLTVSAEEMPKIKMKGMKKEASCATNAAECTMEQKQEQMQKMKQKQMQKTEEMRKEAGKGSEQGQMMREEHSKKWWKFWGDKTEE